MFKDPKFWGTVATIVFIIIGLFTGLDVKKVICGEQVQQAVSSTTVQPVVTQ